MYIHGFLFKNTAINKVSGARPGRLKLCHHWLLQLFSYEMSIYFGLLILEVESSCHTWYGTSIKLVSSTLVLFKLGSPTSLSGTLVERKEI